MMLCFSMLFAGCSQSNRVSAPEGGSVSSHAANDTTLNKAPERKADVYGKVKTILGNEVTLEVAEMPERPEKVSKQKSEKGSKEKPEIGEGVKTKSSEEIQQFKEQMKEKMDKSIKLTGEVETFIIPVGLPIVSSGKGKSVDGTTTLELIDIYEGMFLQVWFEEGEAEADKLAQYVRAMVSR